LASPPTNRRRTRGSSPEDAHGQEDVPDKITIEPPPRSIF
jgi:hypothetical protein